MANMNGRAPVTEGTSGTLRIATNGNTNGPKVDPKDPQVRKLVYNMYRVMLDQKHQRANDIIDSAPQELVSTDEGVGSRVQSMMRQQNELKGGNMNAGGPPPPPPPPPIPGIIPSSRLPSEIPARVPVMNPPAALAGAMLKDKKPFTYTPGGLDLSEIKSPRMQRRLYRNAHSEGVRPSPLAQQPPPGPVNPTVAAQSTPHGRAVQVLPMPGMAMGPQPQPQLQHKEPPKPKRNVCGPPPPPPPFVVTSENSFNLASTSTSPPILSSLPTSVPVAEPQLAREPGPSIPVAPPLPTHGPAARCSLISASPPSSPLMNAVPSDPSPPPLPPPQAVRIPVTPPIVPVTPPVVPVTLPMVPVTLPAASVMQPSSPVMQPGSPVMQPSTPVMQPSTPVVQPSTPVVQPGTPIMQPGTPIMQPGTPIMQPSTPVMQPGTPIMQPGTPVIQPGTPIMQPGTPIMQPGTPVMQPSTPIMQPSTPAMQPSTPIVQPGTPIIQPSTPIMQPGTPVIPVLPFNARETLCFTLEPTEQPLIECSFTLTSPLKEQALSSDIVISSSMKNDLSPSEEEAFASPEELKSPQITDINIQQNESMLTKAKPSIFEQESIQTIPFEEPSPNKQSPDKEPLPVRHPFKELSPIRQMPIAEPSPITQVPIKETSPIKEVPVISNDSSPIKQDFMKDPSAMKQLITKEPSLVKHPHTKEISPNRQIPIRELSPMKQLYNKEQSPVKQAAVKEPSPVKQAPIKEPSPVKQAPIKEPSPVKQEPIKKPSLMKQAPIKELSSLKQAPKEPSPIKQEPSTEPLPVQQVPLHEHSPAGQGLARQPFPVKHVSVNQPAPTRQTLVPEVSPAEQLPDAQSSIKYSPPPVNIMPLKEPTPVRQLLIKETSPIRQTSLQQPQPVAQSLPAVELHPQSMMDPMPPGPSSVNQKPNQVSNMISGATQKFTFSEQRPARQASMQHPGPARQTSLPEPRQFTEVPIQRLSKQQPTLLRQTSLQDSVLSRQNSVKANNKLTTRHIPVHMELPPYNSGASASPPIVKGASIVRQASLPNKPSSPQVSPPNAQLGSIYVPPVSSDTESTSSPLSPLGERSPRMSPTTGLNKGPLPWMCAQKRTPSPPPSFVTHAQQTQQRLQQHQQNRCLRQRSLGPESPPSQPQVEATVLPQPEVYQHSGFQRQKSLPPQQQQQSQIYPQLIRTQQPRPQYQQPQQSRIIPIQVQQPQQTRTIPIHVQQTQQQQKHRPRERIIPIMIERESPPKNTAQTSTPFIPPAAADSFIPISTDITGSTNAKASFQQPHTSFQQPQASFHQPKASFQQSQPSFQQQQPNLQQSQQYQQPQQWQQYQQAPQQVWSSPGTTFSPPQFSSAPLTESQSGAFHTYNNHHPSGLHSNNNALDALHQMQQSLAQLNSGLQNAFPRLIQKKMSDSITPRTTPSNQPRPQQNGNVATMDQPANGADLGPPIQSRSFRLLQNVLDHQDTADTPCNGMPMKVEVPLGAPTRPLQQSLSLPVYVTQTNGGQKGSLSQPGNMPRGSISQTSGQNNSMTSIGNSKNLQREVSDEWDGRFRVIPIQQSEEEINVIPKHIGGYKANISDTRGLSNIFKNQGSDDEISNYMQQCVPQSHAPVHQGVQPRQHYNQIQNQQPIYQRPEIQGQPQQYQQTASNNKQLAQSKQKEVPTSSRFFRMLQTITDTLPEGAEPQGPVHIPNFRQQQKPPQMQQQGQYQQLGQYQQPGQYQQSNQNQQPGGVRSATAADQAVPEPKKYMGGSIPSRSFKMLQAMTNTDDGRETLSAFSFSQSQELFAVSMISKKSI
nr:proline-rich protein 36-like isoform X2 [Cherax quadricarinatus]